MAGIAKNPCTCTMAKFVSEEPQGSTMIIKLASCSAWFNLDLVDLKPFGLEHRATWERVGSDVDLPEKVSVVQSIGERCTNLCTDCDRFRPSTISTGDPAAEKRFPSDPEYSPGQDTINAGVPIGNTAQLLYQSGS